MFLGIQRCWSSTAVCGLGSPRLVNLRYSCLVDAWNCDPAGDQIRGGRRISGILVSSMLGIVILPVIRSEEAVDRPSGDTIREDRDESRSTSAHILVSSMLGIVILPVIRSEEAVDRPSGDYKRRQRRIKVNQCPHCPLPLMTCRKSK
ncbi:hypothetical protein BHE74_00043717 [Ensete ventricosum]|nr:hypothetical protein BHE74_00043717 [Ensete ventricosum]